MEDNFPKAYYEVLEILKYMPEESVNKIPKNLLETFEVNKDVNHNFKVDINRSFEEQDLLEETKDIFANIFRDYWATPYQKERIIAKQNYDRKVLEEEKRQKYNLDNLFKKTNKEDSQKEAENISNNNLPVEYKETFYQKFIGFLKRIFNL
jgi:hypothetical protein